MDLTSITGFGLRFLLLLPAIILHEWSHGYIAYRLGDPTAKNAGRLSLNPVRHIDPFGTLLLPALMLFGSGGRVAFGYAKPVPINPSNFRDRQTGMLLTGVAGPTMNLVLATVAGLLTRLVGTQSILGFLVYQFAFLNLLLLFFNLIPIPPLDGSRVIQWFLSGNALRTYHQLERYGFLILFGLLFISSQPGMPDIFGRYLGLTVLPLLRLITGVAG